MMCCSHPNRREFLSLAAAPALPLAAAPAGAAWPEDLWDPDRPFITASRALRVQPVLMYQLPTPREAWSWKSWGGIQTEAAVAEEEGRITQELKTLAGRVGFPLEIAPVIRVNSPEAAARAQAAESDVIVLYPATGSGTMLRSSLPEKGDAIIFVRHRSGPVYYWYEALSTRYLRLGPAHAAIAPGAARLSVHDVVVDEAGELAWRLRSLHAVKNFLGARIVALGGAQGKYAPAAPQFARERFKLEIIESSYDDLARRIESARRDPTRMARARRWTDRYLALPRTSLETDREFVVQAFLLYGIFKNLLAEHNASAFTIASCMGTILPMAKTTACLTLSLLNDEGLLAFCESDFVIVPAGMFLRYLSMQPVFLHNSTFPHGGLVTCAHCTAPRRMNGSRYEPARIVTHYESEYGAAPKVEIPPGQPVSFINPEYATGRWVGMLGVVEANPFLPICRSQQDVRILGNWRKLLDEVRDSHWVMTYGEHLAAIGYAAPRLGITWDPISES